MSSSTEATVEECLAKAASKGMEVVDSVSSDWERAEAKR